MKALTRWLAAAVGMLQPSKPAIPEELWQAAWQRLPFLAGMPTDDASALRAMTEDFLARKVFSGAHGYEPDNLARLTIAIQACLPVLKLGLQAYEGWRGIIVYPGEFVIPRQVVDDDGVQHEYEEDALGEAWDGGPVVLSWFDDPADYDGAHVVIHEFAHKLDQLSGGADGMPPLHAGMSQEEWLRDFDAAYADFCQRVDAEEATLIDPYAAENPAEFFAVCGEVFFTSAQDLKNAYPEIYRHLCDFYKQNPASWSHVTSS
ncbi:M90 family metallopeptidase [Viridibacterium curvum]|uniref:Zinc-dependent peptidase n=1 Tax=Viridibacterium curvum TaxID=1101404 RepID=A0ABP9QKB8_9RHOO